MAKKSYILFLFSLLFIISCSQDFEDDNPFPEDIISDEPVFTFSSNNDFYNIKAGVNDFYMFTDYEQDNLEVYSFIARFAPLSTCTGACDEMLTIKIRDAQAIETTSTSLEPTLDVGSYNFRGVLDIEFSDILIEYTDQNGNTFATDLIEQNVESFFEIMAVQDYTENENGDPTKILFVTFQCTLKNTENEDTIEFINANAVIGVAYPG